MPASERQPDRVQQHHETRFQQMGLTTRAMRDGRCLLVSMELSAAPFESSRGPIKIEKVVFTTVGADRIKCLRPRPLFDLPMLDVQSCQNANGIESVIRRAWRDRMRSLEDTERWLVGIGIEAAATSNGSTLRFGLPGESPDARISMLDRRTAILPSTGPLGGLTLDSPEERLITISDQISSSADLECLFSARIDSLQRRARKRDVETRVRFSRVAPDDDVAPMIESVKPVLRPLRKVLIVGPNLVTNAELRQELRRQGYQAATARSEGEALLRLSSMSPDLVLSEYALGRSDGATLIQATRALPGIEGMPVVLIDTAAHERRREAARIVGAAGYVINPPEISRFVRRLTRMLDERKGRRFTRYRGRLQARLQGLATPCLATEVGRGGVFIATDAQIPPHSTMRCEIALPELGRDFRFDGEVLYRADVQGALPGFGIKIHDISAQDESSLIEYLDWLENHHFPDAKPV